MGLIANITLIDTAKSASEDKEIGAKSPIVIKTPPIDDIQHFRNIAFEKEQERVDMLNRKLAEDKKARKETKSDELQIKNENAKSKSDSNLDPNIVEHLNENIFIMTEVGQDLKKEPQKQEDIIGFDLKTNSEVDSVVKSSENKVEEPGVNRTPTPNLINISEVQSDSSKQDSKKKKKNLIRDWQQDLKEFFNIGKSKKKTSQIVSENDITADMQREEVLAENEFLRKMQGAPKPQTSSVQESNDYEDVWARDLDKDIVKHIQENIFIHKSHESNEADELFKQSTNSKVEEDNHESTTTTLVQDEKVNVDISSSKTEKTKEEESKKNKKNKRSSRRKTN